ncbi:MAG TPA: dTDP-4-dehydrorhamnose 3,5-epimerase [Methylomirabilota bacterium]|jgi:dTDP-4-dehydrorhamnose 3,5-epimerase|nr:dTDP-4-dehydrorhamnose 3,5-epimerase [Methylomirabilota bacterium]
MRSLPTKLAGVLLLEPAVAEDPRGFFLETFSRRRYQEAGVADEFVQDNQSRSNAGTIRGLHFQSDPGQAKLVRVARGRIWDVVVDIRRSSATFGRHEGFELDDVAHRQVYVPIGFAHGFCVLSEVADVAYRVSSYYDPEAERGVRWDDPSLGIAWPLAEPILSERDQRLPLLNEIADSLPDW